MPTFVLEPKLQVTRNNDGTLLVKDITGDYSSTNVGGYGDPNIDQSQVTKCFITIRYLSSGSKYHSINLNIATMRSTGVILAATDFTNFTLSSFPDGVFEFEYIVGINAGFRSIPWVVPATEVVFYDNTYAPITTAGIIFEWLDPFTTYLWDRTRPLDETHGFVTTALPTWIDPSGDPSTWYTRFTLYYRGISHLAVQVTGYACLIQDIGAFSFETCACSDSDARCKLSYRQMLSTAIQVKADAGDWGAAHELAVKLQSYCIKENCDCR